VGYAPAEWEALTKHLRGRGFTDAELLSGGLASQGRRGPVDRFRGRLIWPIRDLTGDVIAFGARKLNEAEDGPKYLNTPETPLFRKSSVLYGADLAKRDIAQRRQAVIVEGYTDVMACHLSGITTAVATSGTSFGEGHIKILRRLLLDSDRFRGEVIFTFDGDAAGQRAVDRAARFDDDFITQTFVALQPDGLDPCDLWLKHGPAAVRDLIAQRVPLFEFRIRSELGKHNLETNEGRLAALDAAAPIIGRIKDYGLRDRYAISLDRWLGLMDEGFVLARVRSHSGPVPARARGGRGGQNGSPDRQEQQGRGQREGGASPWAPDPAYDPEDPVIQVEREALKLAVQRPALCGPGFDALGAECFTAPVHTAVFDLIAHCGGAGQEAGGREWAERLRGGAPDDRARGFVTRLAVEPLRVPRSDGEADARYADSVLARLEELSVSREIARIKSRLQRMSPVDEESAYNRMFGDLVALEQRKKTLHDRSGGAL
jgi:DNA primase